MDLLIKTKKITALLLTPLTIFVFGTNPTITFAHESKNENAAIIHINERGFEPEKITVKSGTEVIFENVGKEDHWPATDNHPTHTLYDGTNLEEHCTDESSETFDSCEPVSAGESWSFVFEKTGTFSYHDHLWPHLGGEIIVKDGDTGSFEKKNIFLRFLNLFRQIFIKISSFFVNDEEALMLNIGNTENEFYKNLKTHYETIVLEKNPREAIRHLQEDSSKDGKISALCHDILHEIGHTAYQKYGNFKDAAKFQSDFCNSGYIHGIFESYFETTENPLSGLAEQCNEYASFGGRQFDLWQCHHGVGHGFMYLTGGDLDKSLALCEEGLDKNGALSCQNGVFMEVFNLELLAKENRYIDPENPFLTCSTRDLAKGDCYLYIPTYLSQTKGMNFSSIFDECDKAEFGYTLICIQGIGSEAIKRNMNKPELVFTLCKQAGSFINQETCIMGVTGMYMNQTGSYTSGKKLCKQAPQEFQGVCNNAVNSRESFFR